IRNTRSNLDYRRHRDLDSQIAVELRERRFLLSIIPGASFWTLPAPHPLFVSQTHHRSEDYAARVVVLTDRVFGLVRELISKQYQSRDDFGLIKGLVGKCRCEPLVSLFE
ncbi:MAG TPA: hypothetical protein VFI27_10780, partial [candidate division Zixibacteria bacterium]|nr:hypothetical protein [candidate division Zixibacteria bacterium]